jgi:succinyl-CoA synthetase alpha subunit
MSVLVNSDTRLLVQGMGKHGTFHAIGCREYGTNVVGGVTPGKGGTTVEGFPLFDTVHEAVSSTGANVSVVFVPPAGAADAILEAADAGIPLVVAITEGIPTLDMVKVWQRIKDGRTRLIGPNCPGIISPGERCKVGIMPGHIHKGGPVGVVSRSGTLTYEAVTYNRLVQDFPGTRLLGPNCPGIISPGKCNIGITAGEIAENPVAGKPSVGIVSRSGTLTYQALYELKQKGIGVSTCVGIGGDPVPGTSFVDCLAEFEKDPETAAVMMIGEIGGTAEEEAAAFIQASMTKPVVCYVAGVTAPPGKKMGHAGAIVSRGKGTAEAKMTALRKAGAEVGDNPTEAGELMAAVVAGL